VGVWIGSESERARFIDDVMVMWPLSDRSLTTERQVEKLLGTISGHHKYLPPYITPLAQQRLSSVSCRAQVRRTRDLELLRRAPRASHNESPCASTRSSLTKSCASIYSRVPYQDYLILCIMQFHFSGHETAKPNPNLHTSHFGAPKSSICAERLPNATSRALTCYGC
jgi:hypothetical protein